MDKFKVGDKVYYNHKATKKDFNEFGNAPENYAWLEKNEKPLTIIEVMFDDMNPDLEYALRFKELSQWWRARFFKKSSATQLLFKFMEEKNGR
jgi:hypothetical protein